MSNAALRIARSTPVRRRLPRPTWGFAGAVVAEATCLATSARRLVRDTGPAVVSRPDPDELRAARLGDYPVMLVHGLGADKSSFTVMARGLRQAGYTVYGVEYSCRGASIPDCGRELVQAAAHLREETGCSHAHVVAHSLGGVVLRWAVAHSWLSTWVSTAVTLGSPHAGTPAAKAAPTSLPGIGGLLHELRPRGLPEHLETGDVRWVAVAGEHDWIVPSGYAALPEGETVRNVRVRGCGHLALPSHPTCLRIVLEELARVEHRLELTAAARRPVPAAS